MNTQPFLEDGSVTEFSGLQYRQGSSCPVYCSSGTVKKEEVFIILDDSQLVNFCSCERE